jgi:biopolymer transport protein ExbB
MPHRLKTHPVTDTTRPTMTLHRPATRHLLRQALAALLVATAASGAQAWWNKDWTQRTAATVDTSAGGVEIKASVSDLPLALRLHSGNFDFASAKDDGSDLRVLAADDKTPLKFHIERFDTLNELAVLWVQLPVTAANSAKNLLYVYAGNAKAAVDPASAGGFDAASLGVFHFSDKQAAELAGTPAAGAGFMAETNALLGGGARLAGKPIVWPASDRLKWPAGGPLTWSLWFKTDALAGTLLQQAGLRVALQGGKLEAQIGNVTLAGGAIKPAAWTHAALVLDQGKARLLLNGAVVAEADAQLPALSGDVQAGAGFSGVIDEVELSQAARSADWLRLAAAAQGVDGKLVKSIKEGEGETDSGSHNYFGILFANLTVDAWVVIGILGVMFVLAAVVMVTKLLFISRTARANDGFARQFRDAVGAQLLAIVPDAGMTGSSLLRLYQAGVHELGKREAALTARNLSGPALNAVKASVDADMVRETHRLNAHIVWLTIAISGGPFLGLLGTVVGVMITFAAIAAAGDVNVNAIAPGIAAALLATVAGLAVAIPALFGYNYLASRIKNLSSDMQIFVDEFITRVAEAYSPG